MSSLSSTVQTTPSLIDLAKPLQEKEAADSHGVRPSQALEASHAVYEDSKLHVLRWPYIKRLGHVLVQLATLLRAPLYVDYYLRDLGPACLTPTASALLSRAAAAGGGSPVPGGGAHPADIQRALLALLEGKGGPERAVQPSMAAHTLRPAVGAASPWVPALAAASAPEVCRSVQLLMFYGILARSEVTCTTLLAAQRAQSNSGGMASHCVQVCLIHKPCGTHISVYIR